VDERLGLGANDLPVLVERATLKVESGADERLVPQGCHDRLTSTRGKSFCVGHLERDYWAGRADIPVFLLFRTAATNCFFRLANSCIRFSDSSAVSLARFLPLVMICLHQLARL